MQTKNKYTTHSFFSVLFKDVGLYSFGRVLGGGAGFVNVLINTYFFTPDKIGAASYVNTVIAFLATLLMLGSSNAFSRYFLGEKDFKQRQRITSTVFLFFFVWIMLITPPLILFYKPITLLMFHGATYETLLLLYLFTLPFTLFSDVLNEAYRVQTKVKAFVFYELIVGIFTPASCVFMVVVLHWGIISLPLSILIMLALVLPFRIYGLRNLIRWHFDLKLLMPILKFGLPLVPSALLYWLLRAAGILFLKHFGSLSEVGIYSVANTFAAILYLFSVGIGNAWIVRFFEIKNENDEQAKYFAVKFFNVILFLVAATLIAYVSVGYFAVKFFLNVRYLSAFYPAFFLILGMGISLTTQVTNLGILIAKRTHWFISSMFVAALVNIGLNYWLIPIWGAVGASISLVFAYLVMSVLYHLISNRFFYLKYSRRAILFFCIIVSLCSVTAFVHILLLDCALMLIALIVLYFLLRTIARQGNLFAMLKQVLNLK